MLPLFVIDVSDKPWLTVNLTSVSGSTLLGPDISVPLTNVPVVVSLLTSTSIITTDPSPNFVIFSTTAVAALIVASAGLFGCVIVWPTKNIGSLTDCAVVCLQRIKFCVENLPSDTRNISTVGL